MGEVIPISLRKAEAVCVLRLASFAFQPNLPSSLFLLSGLKIKFGLPEIPSPSSSLGSALAKIVLSVTASSSPTPTNCCAIRGPN